MTKALSPETAALRRAKQGALFADAALGLRVLPVPRGEDGPDLAAMERLIAAQKPHERPRLYVTVSVLHNPTGASLSLQTAHRVLQLAAEFDLHIVEDDTYAHLAPAHAPRLCALDALERTIYVSGFSKILTPNWRVGFLAAPARLVDRLVDTKLLTTLATPSAGELALAHCLEQGWLRRHAERVRDRLAADDASAV
jgi:DNA-binding transcriptional MocR family regulator